LWEAKCSFSLTIFCRTHAISRQHLYNMLIFTLKNKHKFFVSVVCSHFSVSLCTFMWRWMYSRGRSVFLLPPEITSPTNGIVRPVLSWCLSEGARPTTFDFPLIYQVDCHTCSWRNWHGGIYSMRFFYVPEFHPKNAAVKSNQLAFPHYGDILETLYLNF
jgi:hypothetical protein